MKKLYYLLICLMLPMVFISCGDDEDDDLMGGDIIGTWTCTINDGSHKDEASVTFEKNGDFISISKCATDGDYTEKGTYEYNGSDLIMHSTWNSDYGYESYTERVKAVVKGNKLTLTFKDGGETIVRTLTKK